MTAKSSAPPGFPLAVAVVCPPGVEAVTLQELLALGVVPPSVPPRMEPGLIECFTHADGLFQMNFRLATASRCLLRLGGFNAAAFSELRKKTARLPWADYLIPGGEIAVRVTTHGSKLYHKRGIAERLAGAISDALGKETRLARTGEEDEDAGEAPMIFVRLVRDFCTISIDTSGAHLHRRGYRLAATKAPLRENLAAAILLASGWDRQTPLVDPFCGSGTIPIEAAALALGLAPGRNRRFAFEDWPSVDVSAVAAVRAAAQQPVVSSRLPVIAGSDRDAGAITAAVANAERAGLGGSITFSRRSISDLALPPEPGWLVTNPPYGERVGGGRDLRNLYARVGSVWRERAELWHIYWLCASPRWAGQMGVANERVLSFRNGGLPVQLLKVVHQQTAQRAPEGDS